MYNYNILFYLYHKENHSLYIQPLFLIKDIPYLDGLLLGKASLRIENVKDFIDKL